MKPRRHARSTKAQQRKLFPVPVGPTRIRLWCSATQMQGPSVRTCWRLSRLKLALLAGRPHGVDQQAQALLEAERLVGILESRPHPEQGYRACLGIIEQGRRYGNIRIEAASARALSLDSCRFSLLSSRNWPVMLPTASGGNPVTPTPLVRGARPPHASRRRSTPASRRGPARRPEERG